MEVAISVFLFWIVKIVIWKFNVDCVMKKLSDDRTLVSDNLIPRFEIF